MEAARAAGVTVVEDVAQAHGAALGGRKAGTFGDVGCFSFYPTKNLGALGDGGAVVTGDAILAERVRRLRQYGWASKYRAEVPGGRNSRLDELQAAVLRVMLPRLEGWNRRRVEIAERYARGIRHAGVRMPKVPAEGYVAHLYVVRSGDREGLRRHLSEAGIATDVHYPVPDHAQEAVRGRWVGAGLSETEKACGEVLTLPCFPEMTDGEVDGVVERVNAW